MIRQESGRNNPWGHIKFIFPNEYSVYIHDTPSRSLFLRSIRTFSHGCIRINKAHELAEYLLKDDPEWNPSRLQKAIDQGQERTIILPNPVPVHIYTSPPGLMMTVHLISARIFIIATSR
jgi:murein L,D-transpeptidase YcbB/YkuD